MLGKKRLQRDGVEQEYFGREMRSFEGEQIGWVFITARTVFAGGVVPELVGSGFGQEVGFGRKDLGVKQFGFDGGMNTFDIGVGVGAGRWIEAVFGLIFLLDGQMEALGSVMNGIAIEFDAQIGGEDDLRSIDAVVFEVLEKAVDGEGGVGFGKFVAIGQELGAAGKFADGVLETRQAVGLHLGPVEGNVGEIFDIHLEAGEGGIGGFDGTEIVFAFMTAFGFTGELVLAEDAIEGVVADL